MTELKKKALLRVTPPQKRALAIATIAALVVSVIFLRNYFMIIAVAAIVAYMFEPVYKRLLQKKMNEGRASMITFLVSLLAIFIPLGFVIFITIVQLTSISKSFNADGIATNLSEAGDHIIQSINSFLANIGINYTLSEQEIANSITAFVQTASSNIVKSLASSITGIFSLITTVIIYIYVFLSLLRNKKPILETVSTLNPLGDRISQVYFQKMGSMTKAMVRGQFIIATMQGFASAVGLYIVGFHNLFFMFFLLLTVLSFVPLGAGIVTITMGIILILLGDVWQGAFLIANHLIVVTNIDNVMRPRLVPKDARLDPALTILSVFAGIGLFGFFGIILGPVLMIVIITTLQMFLEVYRNVEALEDGEDGVKPKRFWHRVLPKRKKRLTT